MHLSEIRARIMQIHFLNNLPEDIRLRVAMLFLGIGHEMTATDGHIIFREGEPDNDLAFVLLDGRVQVEKTEAPAISAPAPDVLGELIKFNPIPRRSATVIAEGEAKLLKFAWDDFFVSAQKMFTADELTLLRQALEDIAWEHFAV
ncbi:MAG: cyclic nucleotide-binding domain-containing protein [Candidatus Hydrogenedentes bacterium]|nr:cyclic nucleotide-binding domain-containing protein [Candidatus Hydrogenedentota bacterium]